MAIRIRSSGSMQYASLESCRFGMNVYRGVLNDIDPIKILSDILESHIDIAIIHIPAESQKSLASLVDIRVPYLIADMLVYYHINLKTYKPKEFKNKDIRFVEYLPEHFSEMDHLIAQIFRNYKNHYTANPLIQSDLVEIYQDWAHTYVTDPEQKRIGWLVKLKNQFVGFATCAYETNEAEIILNGIIPSVAGRGIYADLIRYILYFFKNMGFSDLKISTQAKNYAVQKVWSREGFVMQQSFFTIHLNSMMNLSKVKKKEFALSFCIDNSQGNSTIKCTLDTSNFYHEVYFNSRIEEIKIIPEMIISQMLSKYYLTEFPGKGTTHFSHSDTFLKQLDINQAYRVRISFPFIDYHTGQYKSVAKITDSKGDIYFFSYSDLINPQL